MEHPWTQASKFRKNQLGEPCGAYVWAKKGPSFCYFFCIIASTCLKCFKIWLKSHETNRLLNYWSHVGAMFGPFWTILEHVWPSFPFRPARALKFSRLGKYGLCKISRPPIDLKCLRLSHYNLSEAYVYGVILFETISMLFLDCSRTMLTLLLLPDQLKHINFEDWVNMV